MCDFMQDIEACIKGMERYIQSYSFMVTEGAFIVKQWMEHIKSTT